MNMLPIKTAFLMIALGVAAQASAQVIFYESDQFGGRTFIADREVRNFKRFGFNDRASSAVVESGRWEVCEQVRFEGRCKVLRPGRYPSLTQIGLGNRISSVQPIGAQVRIADNRYAPLPAPAIPAAAAPLTFYEHENFRGASFTAADDVDNFSRYGFNNSASSVIVSSGPWEVCNGEGFRGRCVSLAPGRYPSLASIGLNDKVSSVRRADRYSGGPGDRDPRAAAVPGVTFYEREGFGGRSFTADRPLGDFNRFGFNDLASSAVVVGQGWEVCQDVGYGGRCAMLQPGQYPTLRSMNLDNRISSLKLNEPGQRPAAAVASSIIFFEDVNFNGLSYNTREPVLDFNRSGMRGRAQSAEVTGGTWEVCPSPQFGGQCMLLRPGRYPTPASMGLRGQVGSARMADDYSNSGRDLPRRNDERLYEAQVTSVRAVVGTPEQRCWVDREQVERNPNVPAAIAGALLGGLLGNQVGGGTGKDVATIGGVVAGAAIGARMGRGDDSREVRRCEEIPAQARTEYWDVTYSFRGVEYRGQLTTSPGRTVTVNDRGELRS